MTWDKDSIVVDEYNVDVQDKSRGIYAFIKWDGCCEIKRYFNGTGPGDNSDMDHIHLCDVPDMIKKLQDLLELARTRLPTWEGE